MTRALVVATSPDALCTVGGLPLAERVVATLDAAGAGEIAVLAGAQQTRLEARLARRSLADRVRWLLPAADAEALAGPEPVLVLAGDVLVDAEALSPLLAAARPGERRIIRAVPAGRGALRAVICPGALLPALLTELDAGRRSLVEALARLGALDGPAMAIDRGLFVPLDAVASPAALERVLLDALGRRTAAKDSFLAALIDRRLSRPVTRWLLGWPFTPSQITLASIAVGLTGAAGLASGSYAGRLGGALLLVGSIVLDCVDGEVARARLEQSATGARLDVVGDYTVNLATFAGLGIGLARAGLPPTGVWAVAALVAGVAAAMMITHLLLVRPALTHGGDLHWSGDGAPLPGTPVTAIVEKVASRDYTYLLLLLALAGHLEWFLYAAAVGSWLFAGGLVAYWRYHRPQAPRSAETAGTQ